MQVLRRRFLLLCAGAGWLPALALGLLLRWTSAGAYLLTFLLVAGDFLWMSWSFGSLFRPEAPTRGASAWAFVSLSLRMILLLLGLYGILRVFPRESLGVSLGIGMPLALLTAAGALMTRGGRWVK